MASDDKRTLILDAATRRFLHFGSAKTTMMDIANDLAMSKALLYYYFPDKNSLYTAVFEREMERSSEEVLRDLAAIDDIQEALMFLLDMRMAFVKRNFNLLDYSVTALQQRPVEMAGLFKRARGVQQGLIAVVISKGIQSRQIQDMPVDLVSEIVQFALEGMRLSILEDLNVVPFPSQEEFDKILEMQKALCMLLLHGLRSGHGSLQDGWSDKLV
jgi:TetR/AcrR family transcriptional regulator